MDMREVFTIDGRRFSNMAGFYDEVEQVFTCGLDWKIGLGSFQMYRLEDTVEESISLFCRKVAEDLRKCLHTTFLLFSVLIGYTPFYKLN